MRNKKIIKLPTLKIKGLEINPPFILGGMGVRITDHCLVSAVADCGMAGTIASVGLCPTSCNQNNYESESNKALSKEIKIAKKKSIGIIGVNIMTALINYEELVKTADKEEIDYIASGAGLPLNLPALVHNKHTALIPIVSSVKAARIILNKWLKKYNRIPDGFIVEGALAGGHLGYNLSQISNWSQNNLLKICLDIKIMLLSYPIENINKIPIIAAGGIFDGKDIAMFLKQGINGVQLATRFIATNECSVPDNFKNAIINCKEKDMVIINSPVGLYGSVLKNNFIKRIISGEKMIVTCPYHCLKTCKRNESQYCIAQALVNAQEGNINEGIIMAGHNAYKIKEIVSAKQLVNELVTETLSHL